MYKAKEFYELLISLAVITGSSNVYIFTHRVVYTLCCEGRLHSLFIGGASEVR